ncbi:Serine dehydratase-like, partial [Tinamus guttatus]
MAAQPSGDGGRFHIVSPMLESVALSKAAGTKVYMKLENVQPTGSFKIRGIGYIPLRHGVPGGWSPSVALSCAGGNAGLATAYAARKLGLPATVVVPSSAGPMTVRKLHELGAHVEVSGKVWDDAHERAEELAKTEGFVSIHPFDHPLICLHAALEAGRLVSLPDITRAVPAGIAHFGGPGGCVGTPTMPHLAAGMGKGLCPCPPSPRSLRSVAKCLGAKTVSARALQCAQELRVISQVVENAEAVQAIEQFLGE